MRKVLIENVDMYGFNGRDNHPNKSHEGKTGVVLNSYWEKFNNDDGQWPDSTGLGTSKADQLKFARKLITDTDEEQEHYEVMDVYIPETDEIICLLSFEVRFL